MNSLYANPNQTKGKVKQPPILKGVVGKPANGSNSGPIRTPAQGGGDRYPGPSGGIRQATPAPGGDVSQPGGFKPSPKQLQQIYDAARTGGPQAAQAMIAQTHGPAAANAVNAASVQSGLGGGGMQSIGGSPSGGIRALPGQGLGLPSLPGPGAGPGVPQPAPQISSIAMPQQLQNAGMPSFPPPGGGGMQAGGMPTGGMMPGMPPGGGGQDLQAILRQRLLAARMPQQAPNIAVQPVNGPGAGQQRPGPRLPNAY